ncbi:MAG: alpha/beta hydrolase [Longispora sp.]|nr:alpha/beta hydrolase [Longispora sp. (in: high G+C Gram-positive bacteria)]
MVVGDTDGVVLETLVTGAGDPVTVFAHGLAGGIADTRPLGSNVTGRRVFFQFRGHGESRGQDDSVPPPETWTYEHLATDLSTVANAHAASRALGVSLGAGALCRLLTVTPDRFERLVFFLPAVLDEPRPAASRTRLAALIRAVTSGDRDAVAAEVAREIPEELRGTAEARAYAVTRTRNLLASGLSTGLADLPDATAVTDRASLTAVTAPALVLGCRGDVLHPVGVAERLAESLPTATLHVYDEPYPMWRQRGDVRRRVSEFLNGERPNR